jgi:adenosine kinase
MNNILICGSIAYDTIMVFEDYFKDHILPDQIHKLSVSFYVPELKKNFGGTAGNIAYNLRLLNSSPIIMATVGDDFTLYSDRLSKLEIMQDYIRIIPETHTAQAFITTDLDDNQITAFHPGAMTQSHKNTVSTISENISLAVIAPDGKDGMINHSNECYKANIPILFDPGQGLPMFNQEELLTFIEQASYIAVNDYEAQVLSKATNLSIENISKKVTALIITKGNEGSLIYTDNKIIKIDPFYAANIIDPTGCGDAYRSGLIYGIVNKLSWEKTGWLASIMGGFKIESQGGQNHTPSINAIESYFGEKLG